MVTGRSIRQSLSDSGAPFIDEWHTVLNAPVTPADVAPKTKKKFWWKCKNCDYEWQSRVEARWRQGCPECGKRVNIENRRKNWLANKGSVAERYPHLFVEWHEDNKFSPAELTPSSSEKILWKCIKGHTWKATVNSRSSTGAGCPFCTGARLWSAGLPSALQAEFSIEQNSGTDVSELSAGSPRKVWWKCARGHTWQASVASRARNGRGCPYCAGQIATPEKNLALNNPQLLVEWDYEANGSLTPRDVLSGSGKRVWWRCGGGHSWRATVASRSKGTGCPYCANQRVSDTNSLLVCFPELVKSWHYEKNAPLTPDKVVAGSGRKVWWLCGKGHEWQSIIATRSLYGAGCPVCRPQTSKVELRLLCEFRKIFKRVDWRIELDGSESDLVIPHLKVCIEVDGYPWHKDKLEADRFKTLKFTKAGYRVFRLRDRELPHIDDTAVEFDNRQPLHEPIKRLLEQIKKLPNLDSDEILSIEKYCSSESFWAENEFLAALAAIDASGKAMSFADEYPELLLEWDVAQNLPKDPAFFSSGSAEKVWWRCAKGHSWLSSIRNRARLSTGCPWCKNVRVPIDNSLAKLYPDVAREYLADNLRSPEEISPGSSLKVKWKCGKCGFVYVARPADRIGKQSGCPACTGKVASTKNSLAALYPELVKEWDFHSNAGLDPDTIVPGSHKRVAWKCASGHKWTAVVRVRALRGMGKCPECGQK